MFAAHALKQIRQNHLSHHGELFNAVSLLNLSLTLLTVTLLTYYIVQANVIAADAYRIKSLQDRLLGLEEQNTVLLSEKSLIEDASVLQTFAQEHGMVSAGKEILYLFDNNNVALGGR